MRISDWSSDVCSSDLARLEGNVGHQPLPHRLDLIVDRAGAAPLETDHELRDDAGIVEIEDRLERIAHRAIPHVIDHADDRRGDERSEEHTSELQSLMRNSYAVCCLKKKKENEE